MTRYERKTEAPRFGMPWCPRTASGSDGLSSLPSNPMQPATGGAVTVVLH